MRESSERLRVLPDIAWHTLWELRMAAALDWRDSLGVRKSDSVINGT